MWETTCHRDPRNLYCIFCCWAVTEGPSELLSNQVEASPSVTLRSCARQWWEDFYNKHCWLILAAKVSVKLEPVREDLHLCGLISESLQMQDLIDQILPYSCTISSKFKSLQKCKKVRIEKAKRQSDLDFFFLVYTCVNTHLLTMLYMSILYVFSCAHEPESTWRKEDVAE